ncbi:MAG TPA: HutD family protein [Microbacterium sp.]|uniref:HutD/Ves family protein n=1 Tax=Microbacterium sp. TaxID=51671 RepID=UPI002B46C1C2|nr:HutD family protein [Microbacterium sp.]HKT55267.1 HutD family protein [Microbacterium sp.]
MTDILSFVDYAEIEPRPWKNGRGITRNLFGDGDGADDWTWRISIAEITGAQPYSPYPGVSRGQVALGPGAVDLTINGRSVTLQPEGIAVFDGEDAVTALPSQEGFLDLNVMTRRDAWTAEVETVDGGVATAREDEIVILVALDAGCAIDGRRQARLDAAALRSGASPALGGRFVSARLRPVSARVGLSPVGHR